MTPLVLIPLTLIFVAAFIIGRNELIKRRLTCPRTGTTASVDVLQRYDKPDKPVNVSFCSLLPGRNSPDCDKGCLGELRHD